MISPVLRLTGLTKRFRAVSALESLTLEVEENQVVAFLGENSAGKSTTIKLLMGFLRPTSGSVRVWETNPWSFTIAQKERIGYVSEDQNLPAWMTLQELARFHAAFYPRWSPERFHVLLRDFELPVDRPLKTLSKGQRRRAHLILLIAQDPTLMILDEPASGLDTSVRVLFLQWLNRMMAERPRTIFFSTHILSDVERIATHMALLHRGRLALHLPVDSIKERVRKVRCDAHREEAVGRAFEVIGRESDGHASHVWVADFDEPRAAAVGGLEPIDTDLEEAYVALVAREKARTATVPA